MTTAPTSSTRNWTFPSFTDPTNSPSTVKAIGSSSSVTLQTTSSPLVTTILPTSNFVHNFTSTTTARPKGSTEVEVTATQYTSTPTYPKSTARGLPPSKGHTPPKGGAVQYVTPYKGTRRRVPYYKGDISLSGIDTTDPRFQELYRVTPDPTRCTLLEFRCVFGDHGCIPITQRCDHVLQCMDGSDEISCRKW